jgi:squalene cyclase
MVPLSHCFEDADMTFFRRLLLLSCLGGVLVNTGGCTTAVVAGAAAAGGYIAYEKGYRVRNPITRNSSQDDADSNGQ